MNTRNKTITPQYKEMPFEYINIGEAFGWFGNLYIKITRNGVNEADESNAINLEDGTRRIFMPDTAVNVLHRCEIQYQLIPMFENKGENK